VVGTVARGAVVPPTEVSFFVFCFLSFRCFLVFGESVVASSRPNSFSNQMHSRERARRRFTGGEIIKNGRMFFSCLQLKVVCPIQGPWHSGIRQSTGQLARMLPQQQLLTSAAAAAAYFSNPGRFAAKSFFFFFFSFSGYYTGPKIPIGKNIFDMCAILYSSGAGLGSCRAGVPI